MMGAAEAVSTAPLGLASHRNLRGFNQQKSQRASMKD
jgi:hypothetical protein